MGAFFAIKFIFEVTDLINQDISHLDISHLDIKQLRVQSS